MTGFTVHRIGAEQEPLVIIDAFSPDLTALRGDAQRQSFQTLSGHYPGLRAPANAGYLTARMDLLTEILTDVFDMPRGATLVECNYSLVTTRPEALTPFQRYPHFDSLDRGRLALLHYLSPSELGGTAFFRHRSTGFETLNDVRHADYSARREAEVRSDGHAPARYHRGSDTRFEQIGELTAAPNRMVVYRGVTLHSGVIPDTHDYSPDPALGRLTINTFLQARA